MFRWHYTSKFECPDRDCIVMAELESDEFVLLRYNCDKCTFRDDKCALNGSDYTDLVDEKKTTSAYRKARQARFEHGEHGV